MSVGVCVASVREPVDGVKELDSVAGTLSVGDVESVEDADDVADGDRDWKIVGDALGDGVDAEWDKDKLPVRVLVVDAVQVSDPV